jgi:hypothetical protein
MIGAAEMRWWGARAAAIGCFAAFALRAFVFIPEQDRVPSGMGPVVASLAAGFAAMALFLAPEKLLAALVATAGAAACLVKPLALPILHEGGPFGLTSETHLYYVGPGAGLAFLALLLALSPAPGERRDFGVLVSLLVISTLAALLFALDFAASRAEPMHLAASLAPGALLAILAVVVFTQGVLRHQEATPAPYFPPYSPPYFPPPPYLSPHGPPPPVLPPFAATEPGPSLWASRSYTGDASFDHLIRAIAHAPARSEAVPAQALIGARFGPFVILELLGEGGMGRVYRTRDERLLRDVAIKVMSPSLGHDRARRERMLREARAAAQVNHPSVAAIYDIGIDAEVPYIVMELCAGQSLRALLAAGPLTPERARPIARQIAEGLAAAHAHGIVHRDVKPENVMVAADGRVKVLDFGLARLEEDERAGVVAGTPGYMSPEQERGEALDARSDVYSFGLVLVEMLGGRTETLPDAPALRALAERCLAADPAARYAHAGELVAELA